MGHGLRIFSMNISGSINFFRVFRDPTLCLPHYTVTNFNQLPVPLTPVFTKIPGGEKADIRAVVLDKDNCFAVPYENKIYKPYLVRENYSTLMIYIFLIGDNLLVLPYCEKFRTSSIHCARNIPIVVF